jgi:hypothetical protein
MKESLAMLLKTNIENMSENRSLAMLMKTEKLKSISGDVDENKESIGRAMFQGIGVRCQDRGTELQFENRQSRITGGLARNCNDEWQAQEQKRRWKIEIREWRITNRQWKIPDGPISPT